MLLIGNARNIMLRKADDGSGRASVEVVLVGAVPRFEYDASGLCRTFGTTELRFEGSPECLRNLAADLVRFAGEAEKFLASCGGEKAQAPAPGAAG